MKRLFPRVRKSIRNCDWMKRFPYEFFMRSILSENLSRYEINTNYWYVYEPSDRQENYTDTLPQFVLRYLQSTNENDWILEKPKNDLHQFLREGGLRSTSPILSYLSNKGVETSSVKVSTTGVQGWRSTIKASQNRKWSVYMCLLIKTAKKKYWWNRVIEGFLIFGWFWAPCQVNWTIEVKIWPRTDRLTASRVAPLCNSLARFFQVFPSCFFKSAF